MSRPAIYVNLSVPKRAVEAPLLGAEGVGLMRSEFLVYRTGRHPVLLATDAAPNNLYTILADAMRAVARAFYPKPVTYRSLDLRSNEVRQLLGGEQFEDFEENPALGCRGISRSHRDQDVFVTEIRALHAIRAEGFDNIRLLLPFVRWPEEVTWAREVVERLAPAGVALPEVWMMVETPTAFLRAEEFAPLVDGVSIGSNDLAQFIIGVDRDNAAFAHHDWDADPGVLAGIKLAITSYTSLGVEVGICGDAPSRSDAVLSMLLGLGLSSISVSMDRLGVLRSMIDERFVAA